MERDAEKTVDSVEQIKKFVKLIKQLDEKEQRALLMMLKGAAVLASVESEPFF